MAIFGVLLYFTIKQANKYIISKSKFQVGGSTSKFLHLVEEVILQCPLEYIELNDIFEKILIIFYVEGVKAPLPPLLQSEPPWRGNHELNNCLPS